MSADRPVLTIPQVQLRIDQLKAAGRSQQAICDATLKFVQYVDDNEGADQKIVRSKNRMLQKVCKTRLKKPVYQSTFFMIAFVMSVISKLVSVSWTFSDCDSSDKSARGWLIGSVVGLCLAGMARAYNVMLSIGLLVLTSIVMTISSWYLYLSCDEWTDESKAVWPFTVSTIIDFSVYIYFGYRTIAG